MAEVKPEDVDALVQIFDESDWDELRVSIDGFEIYLSKNPADRDRQGRPRSNGQDAAIHAASAPAGSTAARSLAASLAADSAGGFAIPDGFVAIRAPNLGTFYRAPKPGAAPYVDIGQKIEPDTEICLIEVMKLFTPVRAGVTGIVREVLVSDGHLVEYDQPLFLIEPR